LPHGLKIVAQLTPVLRLALQNLQHLSEMSQTVHLFPATNPTDVSSISPERLALLLPESCLILKLLPTRHMFCRRFGNLHIRFRAYKALSIPRRGFRITGRTNKLWPLAPPLLVRF